jgi:hypothetical protein
VPETLTDWFPPEFARYQLSRHPAPKSRATGEPMWEKGIRLHGQQANAVMEPYRFKKIDGGIRFGKSFSGGVMIYLDLLWRWTERGIFDDLYGIIGDSYAMAQEEMNHLHRLLEERGFPHEFFTPENASWRITFPEIPCMVRTLTASSTTAATVARLRARLLTLAATATTTATLTASRLFQRTLSVVSTLTAAITQVFTRRSGYERPFTAPLDVQSVTAPLDVQAVTAPLDLTTEAT